MSLEAELMAGSSEKDGQAQLDALGTPPAMLTPGDGPPEEGPGPVPDPQEVERATREREAALARTNASPATQRAVEATLPPTHPARQAQAQPTPQAPQETGQQTEKLRYAGKYETAEELEKAHIEVTNMAKANYKELQESRAAAELGEQARPLVELIGKDPELQQMIKEHVAKRNAPPEVTLNFQKN